jgi:hypothetical protein
MPAIDEETNTVEVINISAETVKFNISGTTYKLAPREKLLLHKSYALPRLMQEGRDPVPAVIELLTGQKVLPIDDKRVRGLLGNARRD